jgi:hypothetical protein
MKKTAFALASLLAISSVAMAATPIDSGPGAAVMVPTRAVVVKESHMKYHKHHRHHRHHHRYHR